jgi:hypothetical protein
LDQSVFWAIVEEFCGEILIGLDVLDGEDLGIFSDSDDVLFEVLVSEAFLEEDSAEGVEQLPVDYFVICEYNTAVSIL